MTHKNSTSSSTVQSRASLNTKSRCINRDQYPAVDTTAIAPSLHNIACTQELLQHSGSFSPHSTCTVLEIRDDEDSQPLGQWLELDNSDISDYLETLAQEADSPRVRAIFCNLRPAANTRFGFQLSLGQSHALKLLSVLKVCPQFCPSLLGEPDYWAPLEINTRQKGGQVTRAEFSYQHPRYDKYARRDEPCSVYISYDFGTLATTYIVISGLGEPWVERAKCRLSDYFVRTKSDQALAGPESLDPFLIQSLLCHESLVDAKRLILELRGRLYHVLDTVSAYSKTPFDRRNLNAMTNELHNVSKDADSLFGSAEMGLMVAQHSLNARKRILRRSGSKTGHSFEDSNVGDALSYLIWSINSQKRYIQSYKFRKDTAMNLVFNLVTQQDSETSVQIARDTRNDSASMKTIAVLTMVFLPATAVSGFFGMAFFGLSNDGNFTASPFGWIFAAVTIPLTVLILLLWAFWSPISKFVRNLDLGFRNFPGV
ncbi:hypothetical protein BGZ63DRAFT_389556 [Mariannaea sp. PMI_226]|nr:hypothetical protein BGZ63DRAFT_389556 [Mariannaea sp. PMI_226]